MVAGARRPRRRRAPRAEAAVVRQPHHHEAGLPSSARRRPAVTPDSLCSSCRTRMQASTNSSSCSWRMMAIEQLEHCRATAASQRLLLCDRHSEA